MMGRALVSWIGFVGVAACTGVFPLAGEKSRDCFGSVTGAAAMDLDTLAIEDIQCTITHIAGEEYGNAFFL